MGHNTEVPKTVESSSRIKSQQQDNSRQGATTNRDIKINKNPIDYSTNSLALKNDKNHQQHIISKYTKATMAFRGHHYHQAKGKIINKLALVLLSIVILELVLIGDQVQPVKAIKKKIFLKKLKKMLPLLALIKPKKKIILLPIPIPMQMMKQSHFGGRYPMPGPPLIMPMNPQVENSNMKPPMPSYMGGLDMGMGNPNAPMMMGTIYPMENGPTTSSGTDSGGGSPPAATMQVVAPPTTMTMTITAGDVVPSSNSGTMLMPPAPLSVANNGGGGGGGGNQNLPPVASGNLLSYQAATASLPHGDTSGEFYYSSPYNKNNNLQQQSKVQQSNSGYNNNRLRSPVHYGQQQQQHHHHSYNHRQKQRDQPSYDSGQQQQQQHHQQQQQQQMTMHEIEMEFAPSSPIQQHQQPLRQQQQMIPFYPSDSDSSQSTQSVVQLPVLNSNSNSNINGKLTSNLYEQISQQQIRDIEGTKSSALPQTTKSGKLTSGGGY